MSGESQASDTAARLARNESMFRTVNEQIDDVNAQLEQLFDVRGSFVCECSDSECIEQVEIAVADYARIRKHATRFVVAPGEKHLASEGLERVIEKGETYWVVEKLGDAGAVARELAPGD